MPLDECGACGVDLFHGVPHDCPELGTEVLVQARFELQHAEPTGLRDGRWKLTDPITGATLTKDEAVVAFDSVGQALAWCAGYRHACREAEAAVPA
jgi:hypothetical protein